MSSVLLQITPRFAELVLAEIQELEADGHELTVGLYALAVSLAVATW